jgi:hypothetical protein
MFAMKKEQESPVEAAKQEVNRLFEAERTLRACQEITRTS